RQRVQVAANGDGRSRMAPLDVADQPGRQRPFVGYPPVLEVPGDEGAGLELLEAELGVLMKVPAPADEILLGVSIRVFGPVHLPLRKANRARAARAGAAEPVQSL